LVLLLWVFFALYKNRVIVAPIGKEAGMVTLRKSDGRAIWESSPIEGRMSYASCTLAHMGGIDQVMIVFEMKLESFIFRDIFESLLVKWLSSVAGLICNYIWEIPD
jgi:hypothetical protein